MAKSTPPDYYRILGVDRRCTLDQIKAAYKALALIHHPDKNPNNKNATEHFQNIVGAYSVLNEHSTRVEYNFEYDLKRNRGFRGTIIEDEEEQDEKQKTKYDSRGRVKRTRRTVVTEEEWVKKESKRAAILKKWKQQEKEGYTTKKKRPTTAQYASDNKNTSQYFRMVKEARRNSPSSSHDNQLASVKTATTAPEVPLPAPQRNADLIDDFNNEQYLHNRKSRELLKNKQELCQTARESERKDRELAILSEIRKGRSTDVRELSSSKATTGVELDLHRGKERTRKPNNRSDLDDDTDIFHRGNDKEAGFLKRLALRRRDASIQEIPADSPRLRRWNDAKSARDVDPIKGYFNINMLPCLDVQYTVRHA